jgi:tRNA U34 2-thiouridine synthase MnmA/TrmU
MTVTKEVVIVPFFKKDGSTHFTCVDCNMSIMAAYKVTEPICLECEFIRQCLNGHYQQDSPT